MPPPAGGLPDQTRWAAPGEGPSGGPPGRRAHAAGSTYGKDVGIVALSTNAMARPDEARTLA